MLLISILHIILIISMISQVSIELGIANHVWQEKRAAIAARIDGLGDKFKPHRIQRGCRTSARPILLGRLEQLTSWELACWRLIDD